MLPEYLKPYAAKVTLEQYKESRKRPGIPTARSALHNAAYGIWRAELWKQWDAMGGELVSEYDARDSWEHGETRLRIVEMPDCHASYDDLAGDCFDPDVNTDIPTHKLKEEEQAFIDRINRDGVYGYRAEYWDGSQWVETDSIWGFVGDDFTGSCHDDDLAQSAMEALQACLAQEAQEQEAERPDLYATA